METIKQFFSPPIFEHDEDKTLGLRLQYMMLFALFIFCGLAVVPLAFLTVETRERVITLAMIVMPSTLVLFALARSRRTRLSGLLLIGLTWLVTTSDAFTTGGVRAPSFIGYVVVILIAGLLLGGRAGILVTVISLVSGAGMAWAESSNRLPVPSIVFSPVAHLSIYGFFFLIVMVLQQLASQTTRTALRNLRTELAERTRAENALRESEALYQSLVTVLPLSLCRKDTTGHITFANARYCQEFRMSLNELVGKTDFDLHPQDLAEKYRQDDRQVIETRQAIDFVEEHLPIGGTTSYVQVFKTPIYDASGIIAGVQIMYWDITERKQAEESVKASLAWRSAMLDNIPDMAWLMDSQFRYIAVNEPFARAARKSSEELVGKTDFEIWRENLARKYRQSDQEVVTTRQRLQIEDVLVDRTGKQRWFETIKTPILNAQNEVIGIAGIAHEVTHRKLEEQTLEQYAKQAHQRAEHLAMLNKVGRAISTLQDLHSMLEVIFEQVRLNLPLDVFFVALHSADTEEITFPILYDNDLRWNEPAGKLDKFERIAQIIRTGQPLLWNRTPAEIEQSRQSDYRIGDRSKVAASIIMAPMQVGQRVIGVMSVQSYIIDAYSEDQLALLIGVAHQAAIAIQNAQLYEQTQQRARQLAMLNEVGRAVSTLRNVDSVLEIIYQQAQRCLPLDVFFVALLNTDTDEVLFPIMYDGGQRLEEPPSPPKKGSTSRLVIQSGQPLLINRTAEELALGTLTQPPIGNKSKRAGSLMFAPLRAGDRIIGAISVQSYALNAYTQDDLILLVGIAHQAAIAIENARLYSTVQQELAERQRAQAEREKLVTELEAKNTELEQFTYTVSHDLKAPLITIRGFLGFLQKDSLAGDAERVKADVARITEATDKMHQLLNELLELSRIGRMMNSPIVVPFKSIVQEAVALVHGRLTNQGVAISIAEDMPIVHGDRVRLIQVVQNLIDNAAKFMGDQSNPRIEIGTLGNDSAGNPVFFVRDNGIGIDPQYHERVFGLFNKLDAQTEGTGVGLALVKRIIEFHGGKIWVESKGIGKGSTFYFTLPTE